MVVKVGNESIAGGYIGSSSASAIYIGADLIWSAGTAPTPTPVYSAMPFTVQALEDGDFTIGKSYVSYSIDGGNTWSTTTGQTTLNLNSGDTVQFKQSSLSTANNMFVDNSAITFNVYGNRMSLVAGDNYSGARITVNECFAYLLKGSNVVDASNLILPTQTYTYCYGSMFNKCTHLLYPPDLLTETLTSNCYGNMFVDCSSLQYIRCLATDISASYCLYNWVKRVPSSGTFYKAAGVTWPSGNSGIPTGWTVIDI